MFHMVVIALLGPLATVLGVMIESIMESKRAKDDRIFRQREARREKLADDYKLLISIIEKYPNDSPNDYLSQLEYPPRFSQENFNDFIRNIDYQIKDYNDKFDDIKCENGENNRTQVRNREYVKEKTKEIRESYNAAKSEYELFCVNEKPLLEIYASQEVLNRLFLFEKKVFDVFFAGNINRYNDDSLNCKIVDAKRDLIQAIRDDLGDD